VHIITGDWDLLVKLRAESVDAIGKFVVDKLRLIKGLEKTLTCMVFETVKETTKINLPKKIERLSLIRISQKLRGARLGGA
jgi:DNA-binding Lrp family transcriptional regulator